MAPSGELLAQLKLVGDGGAAESEDLVRELKSKGKDIELLVFEDEGHDVLKYENRVTCYSAIADFFAKNLKP